MAIDIQFSDIPEAASLDTQLVFVNGEHVGWWPKHGRTLTLFKPISDAESEALLAGCQDARGTIPEHVFSQVEAKVKS